MIFNTNLHHRKSYGARSEVHSRSSSEHGLLEEGAQAPAALLRKKEKGHAGAITQARAQRPQ